MQPGATTRPPPAIRARLLGPVEVFVGNTHLPVRSWPRRQARSILLLLLGTPGHRLPRDRVLDEIWPDRDLDSALNGLYKAVHTLRRTLEPTLSAGQPSSYVDISDDHIGIIPHPGLWVDTVQFEQFAHGGGTRESLRAALDLYRGEFVADVLYADWPAPRRESLRAIRQRAALALAQLDLDAGDPLASLDCLEALLADEPACEEAHQAVIRALLASGLRNPALQQVERCRLALARELDAEPAAETMALATVARLAPVASPAIRDQPSSFLSLPGTPTPTIGRDHEIATVREMLSSPETRLVTIVGPGGMGKTRLAIEAARTVSPRFPDGVAFVDLTTIRNASLLELAIAGALRIRPLPDQPLIESIRRFLATRSHFLLVLDNLEHLPGIATQIANLLSLLPALTILATSREPARIQAEWLYRLDPLPVPAAGSPAQQVASVALFLQRAQAWGGSVPASRADMNDIAALCRQLEGLPLAIELAAARTWESTPGAILAQIENRFAILREGPRDLAQRHQALDATIGWSYDLLPDDEQRLFRGLAVFAGGVAIDALEAMFGRHAVSLANHLAGKSLVSWSRRDGERRLEMLEATRAYARQMLGHNHELIARQLEHARFFADLAVRAGYDDSKRGTNQIAWTRRLEREQENLHLALSNCLDLGESDTALIMTNVMSSYWHSHLPAAQAREWIDRALALEPDGYHLSAGWSAMWGATFAWQTGDIDAITNYEDRARAIWTRLDSPAGLAWVNHSIANRLGHEARHHEARRLHEANLRVFRRVDDLEGKVKSLCGLSCALLKTGHLAGAVDGLEEALALSRTQDNLVLQSFVLARLPAALLQLGDDARAGAAAVESERIAILLGDRLSLPWPALARAQLARYGNDHAASLQHAQTALARFQDAGDRLNDWEGHVACLAAATGLGQMEVACDHAFEAIDSLQRRDSEEDMAHALLELASLALRLDQPAESLTAYAAATRFIRQRGIPILETTRRRTGKQMATARARLSAGDASHAWSSGEQMGLPIVLDRVRHCLEAMPAFSSIPAIDRERNSLAISVP